MMEAKKQFSPQKHLEYLDRVIDMMTGHIPIPPVVEIFPSLLCPHRCPTCCSSQLIRQKNQRLADLAKILEVIDELAEWSAGTKTIGSGVRRIEFSGGGEPTAHPDIINMIRHAQLSGMEVGMITNGHYLADAELQAAIIEDCSFVRIALDAATEETYHLTHQSSMTLRILGENIAKLVQRRNALKLRGHSTCAIGLKFLVTSQNCHEVSEAAMLAKSLQTDYIEYKPARNVTGEVSEYQLDQAKIAVSNVKQKLTEGSFHIEDRLERILVNKRCYLTPLHPVISADGSVYLCSFFQDRVANHCIGNIYESAFTTIWGSPKHKAAIARIEPSECSHWDCPIEKDRAFIESVVSKSKPTIG